MMVGKCAHAIFEAIALDRSRPEAEVADAATVAIARGGMSFEGGEPEFPTLEEACAGRRLALLYLDRHPLPVAEWMQAELEVNMTPLGWSVVEGAECPACEGLGGHYDMAAERTGAPARDESCARCAGTGEKWPDHWHQLLDLAWQGVEEDAYENPVLVAGGRDYKGWDAGPEWFDRLQGAGYAVALATLFPEARIIRRQCAGYQLRHLYEDEIDLRTEEGQTRLTDYREELALAVKAGCRASLDIDAQAMPGPGCFAGYGGCPYFKVCKPALSRAADLAFAMDPAIGYDSIEHAAEAFALGSALAQEGARQLKGYGGGPIRTPDGHNVGWKDATSPTGKVDANASFWLAREYATFVLRRPEATAEIEGLLRAAGVGRGGKGVSIVRSIVAKCVAAGMEDAEGDALLERCLKPKPGRKLAIWRGPLPQEAEDDSMVAALRKSLEVIESGESAGSLRAPGDPITTD